MAKKQKEKFEKVKPHCNIGTIGHVDHGKTTLTAAITKVLSRTTKTRFVAYDDIDRDPTERRRGITINASHIEYQTEARHYTHIDCPGHQDYIKNMILGANQMDGVILVVAMTEGPKEQTREHIILAKEIGIKYMVVYGNKLDALLEPELKDLFTIELISLLSDYGFDDVNLPFVFGSARVALNEDEPSKIGGESILELMKVVDSYIPQPARLINEPFLMPVEESLSITGRGTVLTGKVERGALRVGEDVEIIGVKKYQTTCIGLEMYRKILDLAEAGENVGILVRSIPKKNVRRGYVVAKPNSILASTKFDAKIYFLTKEEGGRNKAIYSYFKPQFYFRTSSITGSVILPENVDLVMPGDTIVANIQLIEPVALNEGLRFAIREGSLTIGGGVIIKIY